LLLPQVIEEILEAGCDEAGRGCLAGPVYAAAVILPQGYKNKWLNDSKQISEKNRDELRIEIEETALAWAVGTCSPREIEKINILHASILAMHKALDKLKITPEHIAIDGNKFKPFKSIPHQTIVKGDGKYLNIAAASILAKTHRDEYMLKAHLKFPMYAWDRNKGYPTKAHREGIKMHGATDLHRRTFRLLPQQLEIF
jgi:ribonuclease HII